MKLFDNEYRDISNQTFDEKRKRAARIRGNAWKLIRFILVVSLLCGLIYLVPPHLPSAKAMIRCIKTKLIIK